VAVSLCTFIASKLSQDIAKRKQKVDVGNKKYIRKEQFQKAIEELALSFSLLEIQSIFNFFDTDKDEMVKYEDIFTHFLVLWFGT